MRAPILLLAAAGAFSLAAPSYAQLSGSSMAGAVNPPPSAATTGVAGSAIGGAANPLAVPNLKPGKAAGALGAATGVKTPSPLGMGASALGGGPATGKTAGAMGSNSGLGALGAATGAKATTPMGLGGLQAAPGVDAAAKSAATTDDEAATSPESALTGAVKDGASSAAGKALKH